MRKKRGREQEKMRDGGFWKRERGRIDEGEVEKNRRKEIEDDERENKDE